MTWFICKSTIRRSSRLRFLSASTAMMCCSTLALVVFCAATSTISGVCIKSCASLRIGGEKVAEKSRVCRCLGNICMILRISSMKPISSIRSASSSTTISTLFKLMFFCLTWSSSRPTVATTISQPARKSAVCLSILTPPKRTVWRKGRFLMYACTFWSIWSASSRVGVNTNMRTGCMAGEVLDVA